MNGLPLKFAIMIENSRGQRVMFSSHTSEKVARTVLKGTLERSTTVESGWIVELASPAALGVYSPLVPHQIIAGPYTRHELP